MAIYARDVIYIAPNETVLLKFVESFSFESDSEKDVVDKLRDDYSFNVRTISGKEYTVSTKLMQETLNYTMPHAEFAQLVYNRWLWINKS